MTNPIIIHSMKTNHPWNDYDRILFYEVTLMDSININKLVKSDVLQFMLNCNDKSGALRKESYFSKVFPELYLSYKSVEFPLWLHDAQFCQKLWHFLRDNYEQVVCKTCGKPCKFNNFRNGYYTYCSKKCPSNNKEWQENRINTCIEKYGAGSNINKIKETCIQRYGVKNVFQTDEVKEKIKNTSLEKYGVENPGCSLESIEKIKSSVIKHFGSIKEAGRHSYKVGQLTRLRKYGDKNYNNTDKMKRTKLERYGDENYVNTTKSNETNRTNHGGLHNSQTKDWHFSFKNRKRKFCFDNILFDSTWEIKLYKFCKENNMNVIYQPCTIDYYDDNNKHHVYHPDFAIDGRLYEVKGNHLLKDGRLYNPFSDTFDVYKQRCMDDNNVTIISFKEIKNLKEFFNIL